MATAIVLASSGVAEAAEAMIRFDLPAKPLGAALVEFATRAGISLSIRSIVGCTPMARRLGGRFTVEGGLERLLAGTGCGYRMIDARAVEVFPLPTVRAAAPPPRTPPPQAQDLTEVVVIATRRSTPVDRLAYPVSAIDDETLDAQGVADAGGLALITPSMVVTNLGAGRDKILLRGLSDGPLTGQAQSMVGIYLDDVRITYNAPDPDLRLVDMARAEVLRGPQAALYGSGSLGGVLSLVTAAPDAGARAGWISVGGGAARGAGGSSDLAGMFNLPLFDRRGAVRIVAYHEVQGGYIDDAGLGLNDVNRTVRAGLRVSASLPLTDRWAVSGGVVSQAINSDDTQYASALEGAFQRRNQVREPHDNDFAEAHIALRGDLGWSQARWTTALISHRLESRYDATAAPPTPLPAGPAAFDESDDIRSLVTELNLLSRDDASRQWLAGLFVARTRQDTELTLASLGGASITAFHEARRDELTEAALYGEVIQPLSERFSLTLGGRLFYARSDVESLLHEPLAGFSAPFAGRLIDTGFAPKLVLAYSPSPSATYYVQAAEGYRSGGFNTTRTSAGVLNGQDGPAPRQVYRGDELWSFEIGGKWSLLDGRLKLRAAAFQAIWSNIQSDQLQASGLPFTANIGDGRNQGIEVEGRYRSGPLELRADLLVNAPELERANPSFPARGDQSLASAPDMSAGASARYAWPLPKGRLVELDARAAYVGRSGLTLGETTSQQMGDYVTGRLAATLVSAPWRLTLALDNPGDARADTFAYGNPFNLPVAAQTTPLRPRTASLTFKIAY